MKHILLLFAALTVGVANSFAILASPDNAPADIVNEPALTVDGSAGWNSQGGGLIPLYDGYPTVVYFSNIPFMRDQENWSTYIIETPESTECAGLTLRADNWGWTYNDVYKATFAPTFATTVTWTDWDAWRENSAPGNTALVAEVEGNVLTFTVIFNDDERETTTVTYATDSTYPFDGFYLGADGGIVSIQTISFTDFDSSKFYSAEHTYTNSVTMTESWWSQKDLNIYQLFGSVAPQSATKLVISAELADGGGYDGYAFMLAYNGYNGCDPETGEEGVDGEWIYAYPDENGVLEFDLSNLDFDAYCTSICYSVAGTADVVITWTVYGAAVNQEYDPDDPIYDPNAISDIKVDVDAVEVARYNLAGQKIAGEQKGVNIVVYSDGSSKKVLVK